MKLYMAVTPDEYELPVHVAKTVRELARLTGCKQTSISQAMCRGTSGRGLGYRFIAVELPDEEDT